jgi:hypothetical protein
MVRALLSSGYLGHAHMLRPHALELDQQIRAQPAFLTRAAIEAFADRRRQFLIGSGVESTMESLHTILTRPGPDEAKATQFIDRLRSVAPPAWVAIELARGTWKERLSQLSHHGVLRFDARGLDIGAILNSEPFKIFHSILLERRKESALSNVHDAAALATLHHDINSKDSVGIVRFYTETKVVANLWNDPRARPLLSYPGSDPDAAVLRDADYFFVRANYDALRFERLQPTHLAGNGTVSIPIDELSRVSDELNSVVADGESHFEATVRQLYVGDEPLSETLQQLKSLSFVRNVWFQYEPPEILTDSKLWSEVWQFSEDAIAGQVLDEQLAEIRKQLGNDVSQMQRWSTNFREVLSRAGQMKTGWRANLSPEPMRDLGIARWGIRLEPAERERLKGLVVELMSGDGIQEQASASIASLVESAPSSLTDTVITVCVLWYLRYFTALVDVVNEHEQAVGSVIMPSLRIMRAAARLLGSLVTEQAQIDGVIDEVVAISENAKDLRRDLLIGGAFVFYYAWNCEHERQQPDSNRMRDLAERSFALGDEAVKLLSENTLERAFAMNHCAYVGSVTGIQPEQTGIYVERLIALRGTDFWHYRFADTVAWHNYLLARDEVPPTRKLARRAKTRARICSRLHEAERLYAEDLGDIFGDGEILGHERMLKNLLLKLEC